MAGEKPVLKPKSYHVMFYNIKEPHVSDELLKAKILFNKEIEVEMLFKVLIGNKFHKHY